MMNIDYCSPFVISTIFCNLTHFEMSLSFQAEVGILDRNIYALLTNDIIICFALLHNIILTTYHSYRLICNKTFKTQRIQCISIFTMIVIIQFNISLFFITFDIHPSFKSSCKWIVTYTYFSYMSVKGALFYLFSERLFQVFEKSSLRFTQFQIWLSRFIIFLLWIISVTIIMIFGDGQYDQFMAQCITNDPIWLQGLFP